MNEEERWQRVLEAHRDEHESMHERGLARVTILGRPRTGVGYILPPLPPVRSFDRPGPTYRRRQRSQKRRRPLRRRAPRRRLGAMTEEQKTNALGVTAVVAVLGAFLWFGYNAN